MNFYKHHLGDYDGHTTHLTWDEDMAYTRLLRAYYRRECPIPEGEAYRLARANSSAQKKAVDQVLREFFFNCNGHFHNKRADEEIIAYQAQASTNRRIAQTRIVQRTVNESSTKGTPNQIPEPDTKNQEKTNTTAPAKKRACAIPENFCISENVRTWATERGYADLDRHLEHFMGYAKANGKTYSNWDQGFMNAIRDDWAHLRNGRLEPDYSAAIEKFKD